MLLKPTGYGVTEEGSLVKLQIGNSVLPMTWDVALRMGARLRVAVRAAQEYIGQSRELGEVTDESVIQHLRKVVRESYILAEGQYRVFDNGPDVVLRVGNACLTMAPDVGRNISTWLTNSARNVQAVYASDMVLNFHVAQLTDANVEDRKRELRRDATVAPPSIVH